MKNLQLGKVIAALLFVATLIANYIVNALTINGTTTGQVSDSYLNLFTPAGFTFAIWGVIYFLLGIYVLRQFGLLGAKAANTDRAIQQITPLFILTSLLNIAWVFAWQYYLVWLALLLIAALMATLAVINVRLSAFNFGRRDNLAIKLPFAVYFGWLTVATIANTVIWLVSLNWDGWGVDPQFWTVAILVVGAIIGLITAFRLSMVAYILVFAWAYFGIVAKHVSADGFDGTYPGVIVTGILLIAAFLVSAVIIPTRRVVAKIQK